MSSWASCQISKILGCACAGNVRNVSPPLEVSDPRMHHGTCVMHMPWCILGSLSKGFLWSRRQGKRSWHSRGMCSLKIYVSGKRPMSSLYLYAYYTSFMTIVSSPVTVNPLSPPLPPPPPPQKKKKMMILDITEAFHLLNVLVVVAAVIALLYCIILYVLVWMCLEEINTFW